MHNNGLCNILLRSSILAVIWIWKDRSLFTCLPKQA